MSEPVLRQGLPSAISPLGAADGGSTPTGSFPTPRPLPTVPDHELLKCIGRGSYGEVWLARNIMGAYRAVKVVYRSTFDSERPYDREFEGLQKFEPVSRTHESQLAILHVGRNDRDGYFYHVMELADDASAECGVQSAESRPLTRPADTLSHLMGEGQGEGARHATLGTRTRSQNKPEVGEQRSHAELDVESYVPRTLRSELKARARLRCDECLKIGLGLTTALAHLHNHGLIHRDIKLSNIIFVNGLPKLADIGLVATVDATCSFVGTEGYLPPEGPGTAQADLYSLGKVLYEISTGKDRREFPELPTQLESLEDEEGIIELNAVVVKACKPDSRQRYQSAEQMHDDLLLRVAGKSVRRTHALERRLKITRRVAVAIAAVMVLGVVPYYLAFREGRLAQAAAKREGGLRRDAQSYVYAAKMNLAQWAWEQGNARRVRELLHDTATSPERGFEWYYWQRQVRLERATLRGHSKAVHAAAFSPDGSRIVTASADQTAKVWDARSGRELVTLKAHNGLVSSVAFSPDGERILTGSGDGTVKVWQVEGKELLTLAGDGPKVYCVAFSPDGQTVATAGDAGVVKLYEATSGNELLTLQGHSAPIVSVSFSPDGQRVAAGSQDKTARIWQSSDGKPLLILKGHDGPVGGVAFSPDGRRLITGSEDHTAKVWDAGSGEELFTLQGHVNLVNSVAFSPDGRWIATGSDDMLAKVWDAATGKELSTFEGHTDRVLSVAFSPDGQRVLTGSADNTAKLWDIATDKDLLILRGSSASMQQVVFCPGVERLVTWGADPSAQVGRPPAAMSCLLLRATVGQSCRRPFLGMGPRL